DEIVKNEVQRNITADEAVALHVVDLLAPDLPSLLAAIDGRTVQMASGTMTLATKDATIRTLKMTVFEEFLQLIADPTIAYLLLSLGLLGIWIELSNPGITFPGVAGAISLILGLFALGTLSVNWTGVLLIALAFVLLILDLFVPSLGLLTIGGLISFVIGSYLLFGDEAAPGYEVSRTAIWALTACLLAFALFLGWSVMRARFRPPATGKETLTGQIGEVRSPLAPSGMVRVQGELWRATLEEDSPPELPAGARVVVTRVDGLRLVVRPATDEDLRKVTGDKRR
ncbi:MAG: peptidase, partial [Chloroflexota bacterium]